MKQIKHKKILQICTCLLMGAFLCLNLSAQEPVEHNSADKDLKEVVVENFRIQKKSDEIQVNMPVLVPLQENYGIENQSSLKTLNTFMLSAGSSNMYDTYLSPLEYTGFSLRLMYETMRETTWFSRRFRKQQIIEGEFASGLNPIGNVREYWGRLRYQLGGHYRFYEHQGLKLNAGGFWDINVGGLYNERNGNNPATGRVYTNLNLSLLVSYKWKSLGIRWQVDSPFMGMLLSPKYGQSYYEISLGNTVGLVNFASFHNQRALRNLITLDFPINKYLLRVGYLGDWYQTKVHDIQTHHYTHSFVIGFPLEGVKKARAKTQNNFW